MVESAPGGAEPESTRNPRAGQGRSDGLASALRRRIARGTIGLVLLLQALPAPAQPPPDPSAGCAPVRATPSSLPSLQSGAEALCQAIRGGRPASRWSERVRFRIGGWLDASYQDNDLDSDHSVSLNHANLHLEGRLDDRWKVFFEGEWEYEPDLVTGDDEREWEVEQLYGEVEIADELQVRAGRFNTPFGLWTPVHWTILVDTIEPPLFETERIVPEQQVGLRVFGELFADRVLGVESVVAYSIHGGYGASGLDPGKAEGLTLGSDLNLEVADVARVGVSLYTQRNEEAGGRREDDIDVYAEAALPLDLFARVEYVRQMRDDRTASGLVRNADFVYAKLRWDLRKDTYFNYRFEFGEDDRFGFSADHLVHRMTVGYSPISRIRLKAEYARHDYATRLLEDYDFWGVSAGLFF